MDTDTATRRPANEEILAYLEIRQGRTALDPENITTVITPRDGREATIRTSDLLQVLAERREAIELLAGYVHGDQVHAAARDFLNTIESDA